MAKVLIVDDTPANLRLLSRMLSDRDYSVFAANSGEVALQFLETTVPDIILLDVNMPKLDGYEVCQRIKASERTRNVPVIFVSAMDSTWDKVKAFAVGGVDYIVKPIEEAEVLARLETHLNLYMLRQQLEQRVDARTSEVLRAKAELFTNQILLKSIIDSSTAIIYAKDLDGYYILVNKQFQELFGDT
ncbi:MAG: response regulator, partial [Noviherbaspirillum sp.]